MSALRWSSGDTWTCTAASQRPSRVANWVTGTGTSLRSRTVAPALISPAMMARLIIFEMRAWSRPQACYVPCGVAVFYLLGVACWARAGGDGGVAREGGGEGGAKPRAELRGELDVDQASHAVRREQPASKLAAPDHRLVDRRAGLDLLVGPYLHAGAD